MPEPHPRPPSSEPADSAPHVDDGDESLVRWMLSLTPRERLEVLTANVNAILRARAAQGLG